MALAAAALESALLLAVGWPLPESTLSVLPARTLEWQDRHGTPLGRERGALEVWQIPVALEAVSPHVALALVAAEDRRFWSHGGVDLAATARAAWQNVWAFDVVSGGSTVTQQLARLLESERAELAGARPPPRSYAQKLREALLALRLEQSFDKQRILEGFVNRAPFGNGTVGIEAAARRYFGTGAASLSLARAALLAGLPNAPSALDPLRRPLAARRRQEQVVARMLATGAIGARERERAMAEPLVYTAQPAGPVSAVHAIAAARSRCADAQHACATADGAARLTVDAALQAAVTAILRQEVPELYSRGGRSGAVVVLESDSGAVRALVGSAFAENPEWGEFSAATATRQPGSALKPFVYAAALAAGETAASLAADIERPYPDTWGIYQPENYDGRYHGPVRYREALAQSLNVAAVDVLHRTGVERVRRLLDRLGLHSLDRRADYYGLGLTLGSGGVRLVDLTSAYAALARGGVARPWRILEGEPAGAGEVVLDERVAYIIADILSDASARLPQFGAHSVLATPYFTAVKTGTSKGFRDNWTIGFSDRFTVGVWVGDPTGQPMRGVSGVEGAGTIWRRVMDHVTAGRSERPRPKAGIEQARICHVSGARIGPHCPGGRDELFVAGTAPERVCDVHREVRIDPRSDLLVPPGCELAGARRAVAAIYPSPFGAWAESVGVGRAERYTPRCAAPGAGSNATVRLLSPAPRELVRLDPDAPRQRQRLPLLAEVHGDAGPVTFLVDGVPVATAAPPHAASWAVEPGQHHVEARLVGGAASAVHLVEVR